MSLPHEFRQTSRDAFIHNLQVLLRSIAMFAVFILFWKELIPFWAYFLFVFVVHPPVYLHLHDLCHGFPDSQIWFSSRHPTVADPFWGGMRTIKDTHLDHHKYFCTDKDPWRRLYDGSPLDGIFWNFFESEMLAYEFVKKNGFEPVFVRGILFHLTCMVVNTVLFGPVYWLHVLILRSLRATSIVFFNFWVHRSHFSKDAEYGVYEREKDLGFILPIFRLIYGQQTLSGLIYHNRHHCMLYWNLQVKYYPQVADSGQYTIYNSTWPTRAIQPFNAIQAAPQRSQE